MNTRVIVIQNMTDRLSCEEQQEVLLHLLEKQEQEGDVQGAIPDALWAKIHGMLDKQWEEQRQIPGWLVS